MHGHLRRTTLPHPSLVRLYPTLFAGLCMSTLGEVVGYAIGAGGSKRTESEMELHRRPHVR